MSHLNNNHLQSAQNQFTFQFTKQLTANNNNENFLYSPLSIYLALLMTLFGARGDTFDEIAQTLQLHKNGFNNKITENNILQNKFVQFYLKNIYTLQSTDLQSTEKLIERSTEIFNLQSTENLNKTKKFSISNNLFLEQSFSLKQEFIQAIHQSFHSPVITCNFKGNLQQEIKKINKQIELQTNNLIKNLITKEIVNNLTKLIIVNTIYFLDQWKFPFDTKKTILNHNFYALQKNIQNSLQKNTLQKNTQKVSMMTKQSPREKYFYGKENDKYHWLNLFYQNENFVMTFIVPTKNVELSEKSEIEFNDWFLGKLNENDISSYFMENSEETKMEIIKIPKFKLEYQKELSNILQNDPFVMKIPFSDLADFSGMTSDTNDDENNEIKISSIIHKSIIKVNEIGTEAAAATAAIFMTKSLPIMTIEKPSFILDRPFRFILHNKESKDVLFVGVVNQAPSGEDADF
ncbi:hypothetical protein ABK040_002535 [Willaertia magna]